MGRRTSDVRKPGIFKSWPDALWKLGIVAAVGALAWYAVLDFLPI